MKREVTQVTELATALAVAAVLLLAPAREGDSDPLAIREAHSDGGYWYWLER